MFEKIEIFGNFDQKRNFSKIWLKSKMFEVDKHFHKNRNFMNLFRKFHPNLNFSKIWPKSKFSKITLRSKFFRIFEKIGIIPKFRPKSKLLENLTKIEIIRKFDPNRNYSKIWLKSKFFDIFEYFDQKRNFLSKILPK